jgi:peptidyl-prolyl cis-trans isomerase D
MLTVLVKSQVVGNAFALEKQIKCLHQLKGILEYMLLKNVSTVKAPALRFSPYVAKLKAQSAGDVNRVLPALKIMQQ